MAMLLSVALILAACGGTTDGEGSGNGNDNNGNDNNGDFSVAMVTDVGGIDDKSFNQSAWEGLTAFGEENGLEQGTHYDYAQSEGAADYKTNLNRLVRQDFNLIYGIGFLLADSIDEVASQNPDTNFAIVDSVVEQDNVASITFSEHQGSFLTGVAAALKTKTNKVGFIGGIDFDLINKFEAGFVAGVKSVNPDIDVEVKYAGAFDDASKGKVIASSMYNNGVDIIYHAAGGTGNGVFSEAKDRKNNNPDADIWVIGVDKDQHEEGSITVNGTEYNVTLTSMLKRVDVAVKDLSERAMNGDFPAGEILSYGLDDNGVGVANTNKEAMSEEILAAVEDWKEKIIHGDVEVPSTHDELDQFLNDL
ncbi:BMP family lipoprotein [Salirhabdus salicampi]|uniref:BMP family lipoprotein n=1 Tax=Salirhabdus salicampi TaxID=476102 RepID=UPI00266B7167|nr:BMP family protein [Salirhabdus salicampi]